MKHKISSTITKRFNASSGGKFLFTPQGISHLRRKESANRSMRLKMARQVSARDLRRIRTVI